ncbi:MAG TPA: phage holin family protein [Thermoanaerobaculia bacterium]|nr:phage holin family protein [Thermoanaerobaculia bacterium]
MRQSWSETFRALGAAVLALFKAEIEALERELARSGKNLALGLAFFAAAAAVAFWTLGVATYFVIQLLAVWLPLWAASLIVTALFAAVAGGLAFAGAKKLERFENPLATARRRLDDHMDWWQNDLLSPAPPRRVPGGGESAGSRSRAGRTEE